MMFFIQLFTSKRGPLAKIWLAAHWERKITKVHVFECNLETTIKDIISPQIKIGLRTSSHLLLGVVRIYSRKAKYLLADCNDALAKLKVAFRPGQTDMPVEGLEATLKAITLMEDFTDFETLLPHPNDIDIVDHFSLNQCRTEEITLKEDFGNGFLSLVDFEMLAVTQIQWSSKRQIAEWHGAESPKTIHLKSSTAMSLSRNHDTVTQDNPQTSRHNPNTIQLHYIGVTANISTADISKTLQITQKLPKPSGWIDGDESQHHESGLLDMSYQSLAHHGDAFGDEETGFYLLDIMTSFSDHAALTDLVTEEPRNEKTESSTVSIQQEDATRSDPMEVEAPSLSEVALLADEEEGFALEPVAVTPTSERKKGKRKRRLVVDQSKELSNKAIKDQLADFSDLVAPLDMAPPTCQLMQWKESGGADKLFGKLCVPVINPKIQKLFTKNIFRGEIDGVDEEVDPEEMRKERQEVQRDLSVLTTEDLSILHESVEPEQINHNAELSPLHHGKDNSPESFLELPHGDDSRIEFSHPELPSEDSMCIHSSDLERGTQSTIIRTQSMLDSQDVEERRMTSRVQKLLNILKSQSSDGNTTFSLGVLCERSNRLQAAATFFSLLVLKKQQAIDLHQNTPYGDIIVTPGPRFHDM